jgi:hypothetical protein
MVVSRVSYSLLKLLLLPMRRGSFTALLFAGLLTLDEKIVSPASNSSTSDTDACFNKGSRVLISLRGAWPGVLLRLLSAYLRNSEVRLRSI